ncbi:hypothetical protein F4T90_09720 [Acinetobacter junii]|nr:hypothetical protein [Acinetobacter junii]
MSTHNVLSYAKRIDEICLGEWWQSKCIVLLTKNIIAVFKPIATLLIFYLATIIENFGLHFYKKWRKMSLCF